MQSLKNWEKINKRKKQGKGWISVEYEKKKGGSFHLLLILVKAFTWEKEYRTLGWAGRTWLSGLYMFYLLSHSTIPVTELFKTKTRPATAYVNGWKEIYCPTDIAKVMMGQSTPMLTSWVCWIFFVYEFVKFKILFPKPSLKTQIFVKSLKNLNVFASWIF